MREPAQLNRKLYRGRNFDWQFTYEAPPGSAVDLSGATARFKLMDAPAGGETFVELTGGSGVTLGGGAGTVRIFIAAATTANIEFEAGFYTFDLNDLPLLEGKVLIRD